MILTAESGWSFGQGGYGPDKMKELMQALNEYREEEGLPPVEEEKAPSAAPPTRSGAKAARRDAAPDRTAGDRASSEGNPSDGGGEFTSPKLTSYSQDKPGPRVRRV
jgi:hypothetical protein